MKDQPTSLLIGPGLELCVNFDYKYRRLYPHSTILRKLEKLLNEHPEVTEGHEVRLLWEGTYTESYLEQLKEELAEKSRKIKLPAF